MRKIYKRLRIAFLMEDEPNDTSIFVEYFGSSPHIKVLDFLIDGYKLDYSMTEIARGAGVGWSAFTNIWKKLMEKNIIIQTRTIGNARLFTLNKNNEFVKKIVALDWELSKSAFEKAYEKSKAVSKVI